MDVCFSFHMLSVWEVQVLDEFLNSSFEFSLRQKAPTAHVHNFTNHILTFKDNGTCRYLWICSHLLKKTSLFMQCPCQQNFFVFRISP